MRALHPFSELPHPIIIKASESYGNNSDEDSPLGPISCSDHLSLLEVKSGQWRGGVWEDAETGVRWLVVAGIAKGDHQDFDDFYKRVQRASASTTESWLPVESDWSHLRQETATRILTEWELSIQARICSAMQDLTPGDSTQVLIPHPTDPPPMAKVTLQFEETREPAYHAEETVVEITPLQGKSRNLLWQLTLRVLISLHPPEQDWDRYGDTYSNIADPGHWASRAAQLADFVDRRELCSSQQGTTSHYAHRKHLAGQTIAGRGVRALCGVFFVPTQDHEGLPGCPTCAEKLNTLDD